MYCLNCGTAAANDKMKFCQKCGAPLPASTVESPQAQPQPPVPAPPAPAAHASEPSPPRGSPPAKSGNPFLKIVLVVLGILALGTVLVIGSCAYLGYKVKQKVTQVAQEQVKDKPDEPPSDDISQYEKRTLSGCEEKDRTGFDDYMNAAASASIPLKSGLTLVSIWTDPSSKLSEVEVLLTVGAIESSNIAISQQRAEQGMFPDTRTVCIADLIHARSYESDAGPDTPETIQGTTMFSLSREMFQELKSGQPVNWTYDTTWDRNHEYYADPQVGVLTRVEPGDVPYAIIVNGTRTDLPTIHARATLTEHVGHTVREYEAWFLDDPANPITLNIVDKARAWHITYVKISFPVEEKKIEKDLAQNGRAEIYGIYFDFNSATLRPESEPVLKEISDALTDNPTWKIRIEGHTDNVGGDDYNLRLSQKRADAVKEALANQHQIAAERMSSQGFGASQPKATNDTMEGRALNRRVELVKE